MFKSTKVCTTVLSSIDKVMEATEEALDKAFSAANETFKEAKEALSSDKEGKGKLIVGDIVVMVEDGNVKVFGEVKSLALNGNKIKDLSCG